MDKEVITSKQLIWIPKIDDNLFNNVSKTIKETLENDPLLFIPRPTWQIMNMNRFQDMSLQLLFISISQNKHLHILCKRVKNKIDTLQILYNRSEPTVDLESKLIKFKYKDTPYSEATMRESNIELMKILEKLNLIKIDQE